MSRHKKSKCVPDFGDFTGDGSWFLLICSECRKKDVQYLVDYEQEQFPLHCGVEIDAVEIPEGCLVGWDEIVL